MTGTTFSGYKITKAGSKPTIEFSFSGGDTYPHKNCVYYHWSWYCGWGTKAWTTKYYMTCDPSV